jgi:N-acetylneuraminate epimerase
MHVSISSLAQKKPTIFLRWKIAGELPPVNNQRSLGFAGSIVGIHNNVLIIGGGSNFPDSMPWFGGKKKYYDDLFVLKKQKDGTFKTYKIFKLPFAVAYAACCSTPEGVVAVGGENEDGISDRALLIKWDSVNQKPVFKDLPDFPFKVTNASVAAHENTIYLAGGETGANVSRRFLSLRLTNTSAGWNELPDVPISFSHGVMLVQSDGTHNSVYLLGGRKKSKEKLSEFYCSVYKFSLGENRWKKQTPMPYGLSAGTGVSAGRDQILVFGGDKGTTFHKTESLMLAIAKEQDPGKRKQLEEEKIRLQSSHPGFSKEVLLYNTITDKWTTCGFIPFDVPATTTAVKWKNTAIIPNGEIRAGVRTPKILEGEIEMK